MLCSSDKQKRQERRLRKYSKEEAGLLCDEKGLTGMAAPASESQDVSCFLDLLAAPKSDDLNHDNIMGCVSQFELTEI